MKDAGDLNQLYADSLILNAVSSTHFLFGSYESAESILQLAHWLCPDNTDTLELMVIVAMKKGNSATAMDAIGKLEELNAPLSEAIKIIRHHLQGRFKTIVETTRENVKELQAAVDFPALEDRAVSTIETFKN